MPTLSELLTNEERCSIRASIEEARTFPRRSFVDTDFYEFEIDHVLKESWLALSFSAKISNAGDLIPTNGLGIPVLLIRGNDGVARAFHNVCPYDSCEVSIQAQQGVEEIITPYHGWQYDLEGRLIAANYWDGTKDSKSISPSELNANLTPPCL